MTTIERHNDGTPTDYGRQQLIEEARKMTEAPLRFDFGQPLMDEQRDERGVLTSRTVREL